MRKQTMSIPPTETQPEGKGCNWLLKRIDPGVRESFKKRCRQDGHPMNFVIVELMKAYLERPVPQKFKIVNAPEA